MDLQVLRYVNLFRNLDPVQLVHAAQATAHEDCVLHAFRYNDINALVYADAELALAILWSMVRTLSERLRATNDKVTAMFAMAQFR